MNPKQKIKKRKLAAAVENAQDALELMSGVGLDMSEDLGQVEGWLDAVTSAFEELDELTGIDDDSLKGVRTQIERLYELASCVAYGVVSVSDEEASEAESCFLEISDCAENILTELGKTPEGRSK